jgi:pimeloyl-ACP methyl ester carboxylesterase
MPTRLRAEVAARSHHTPDVVNFWHYAHGDDWQEVVAADSDLLLRLATRGGDLFQGRIRRVRCPVLLTGSLRDASLPDVGQQLVTIAEQLRFCRVFLMSDGDHPLMWTRPGDFRQVSEYFLGMVLQERGVL